MDREGPQGRRKSKSLLKSLKVLSFFKVCGKRVSVWGKFETVSKVLEEISPLLGQAPVRRERPERPEAGPREGTGAESRVSNGQNF